VSCAIRCAAAALFCFGAVLGAGGCRSASPAPDEGGAVDRAMGTGRQAYRHDRYATAAVAFETASRLADASLDAETAVRARCWQAGALLRRGSSAEALGVLDAAGSLLEMQRPADEPLPPSLGPSVAALRIVALLEDGRVAEAKRVFEQTPWPEDPAAGRSARLLRGRIAIAEGDRATAGSIVEALKPSADRPIQNAADEGEPRSGAAAVLGLEGRYAMLTGDRARAAALFEQQAKQHTRADDHFAAAMALGRAGRAHAADDEPAAAATHLIRAGLALRAMQVRPQRWRPLLEDAARYAEDAGLPALADTARSALPPTPDDTQPLPADGASEGDT